MHKLTLGCPTVRAILVIGAQLVMFGCTKSRGDVASGLASPPDLNPDYQVFALRCSKCHSLARPLNSGITDDKHWDEYVARMRRQPGSGINQADAVAILRFLHTYSAAERERKRVTSDELPMPVADGGNQ